MSKPRVGAVIQARMGSNRLPGKVLKPLPYPSGRPLLGCIVNKLRRLDSIDDVVVATSRNADNNSIVDFCVANGITYFRGSEEDVLSRFRAVAEEQGFDHVIRFTADNPFVDLPTLDKLIDIHLRGGYDLTTCQGLPLGMNFSMMSTTAILKSSEAEDLSDEDREHVTRYIKNRSSFHKKAVRLFPEEDFKPLRLTVDYPSDYALASLLFSCWDGEETDLNLVRRIVKDEAWILQVNSENEQKLQFESPQAERKEAIARLRKWDFKRVANELEKKLGIDAGRTNTEETNSF